MASQSVSSLILFIASLVVAAGVCVVLLAVSAVAWVVLARLGVVG